MDLVTYALLKKKIGEGVSSEQIETAVNKYLSENPPAQITELIVSETDYTQSDGLVSVETGYIDDSNTYMYLCEYDSIKAISELPLGDSNSKLWIPLSGEPLIKNHLYLLKFNSVLSENVVSRTFEVAANFEFHEGATVEEVAQINQNTSDISELKETIIDYAIKNSASGEAIYLSDSTNANLQEIHIYGKCTQSNVPSVEIPQPITNIENVKINIFGSNMFDYDNYPPITAGGYIISSTGNPTGTPISTQIIPNAKQILSISSGNGFYGRAIRFFDKKGAVVRVDTSGNPNGTIFSGGYDTTYFTQAIFTAPATAKKVQFGTLPNTAEGLKKAAKIANINLGDTALPYTRGKALQTVAFNKILRGVSVDSGENYTDSSGKKYVADEIVAKADGSVKLIQRIGYIENYNSEEITTSYISSTGELSTGASVAYVLATPIESDVSGEVDGISNLITHYGGTTIGNDQTAYMKCEYVVDSKMYIDNKFNALAEQILNQ